MKHIAKLRKYLFRGDYLYGRDINRFPRRLYHIHLDEGILKSRILSIFSESVVEELIDLLSDI